MSAKGRKLDPKPKIDEDTDARLRQAAGLLIDSFLALDLMKDDEPNI